MYKNEDAADDNGRRAATQAAEDDKRHSSAPSHHDQTSLSLLAANCTFSVNFLPTHQRPRYSDRQSRKTDTTTTTTAAGGAMTTPTKASPTKGSIRRRRSSFELPLVGTCPACGYEVGQVLSQILRTAACGALQQPTQR